MKLIFERSRPGHGCDMLPANDVPTLQPAAEYTRQTAPNLPEITEGEISRHYSELERNSRGVNNGFYPLGSCTMKYNPKINDEMAALPGFAELHPLQPPHTVQGALQVMQMAEELLDEITGMDCMTFQPAAGAHGEYTGIAMIKAYHKKRGEGKTRTKMLVPDAAHGTNPASAAMNGYTVVTIPSAPDGGVDVEALRAAAGADTAGLMLTNPNTLGLFEKNICEITQIVHDAGGLNYYDGANLNAIMGIVRPGDMGFDVIHLNLHKTFSTPHGGGGPGSGAVGCKTILAPFLPRPVVAQEGGTLVLSNDIPDSIGKVRSFYGNFLITLRALCYVLTLGQQGIPAAATGAVLNANYLMRKLATPAEIAYNRTCMHEFVLSMKTLKKETGVSALDLAKGLLDYGIHPPTMYFPLIVEEALMFEPTETESIETLAEAAEAFRALVALAHQNPEALHSAPHSTPVRRPDEVGAARNPVLKYDFAR
ncbi:aminomethyl-transferring glycine dehydrogenase subunit GcvPB [Ruminococcaceae bacterium OttesenSCG-928-A16]|nr:aminomethyl-transferring glycine dehydrogenase subunit GcvPB [Ruminococcaceae bacterium OttesenSCG-928-A16]